MTALLLRALAPVDYAVLDDGHPVGRIRYAAERRPQVWMWNVTIAVPGAAGGVADSLDAAKAAFRASWLPFKASIGGTQLKEALDCAQAARERRPGRR